MIVQLDKIRISPCTLPHLHSEKLLAILQSISMPIEHIHIILGKIVTYYVLFVQCNNTILFYCTLYTIVLLYHLVDKNCS